MKAVKLGAGFVISMMFLATGAGAYRAHLETKFKNVNAQLRRVEVGVRALFVDDCSGLLPENHVELPTHLSTPIAYVKQHDFVDPYGSRGETIVFVPERYFTNSMDFVLISRGPDGDLDAEALPRLLSIQEPISLPVGTTYRTLNGSTIKLFDTDREEQRQHVVDYTTPDGATHANKSILRYGLPSDSTQPAAVRKARVYEFFANHGVIQYDPTNGLVSNGDVFRYSQ